MGLSLRECRLGSVFNSLADIESTEEAVRFLTGENLKIEVPQEEHDVQRQGL